VDAVTYYVEDRTATDMNENEWLTRGRDAYKHEERHVDLHIVEAWIGEQKTRWEALGYTVELFPMTQGTGKNSVRFNVDGPTLVPTTIVWDSGEWEVSVGRMEDDHPQTSAYGPVTSTDAVIAKVEAALRAIGIV